MRCSNAGPMQCAREPRSHETGLGSGAGMSWAGLCQEQPSSPSRSVIRLRWPDPLLTACGCEPLPTLLDHSSAGHVPLPGVVGSGDGPMRLPRGCGMRLAVSALPGRCGAPRGRACPIPFSCPAGSWPWRSRQLCSCFEGNTQPHAAAVKRRAPRHASVVTHGLLKSETAGAAMSQFLSANVPGLVFPSAFLAACKLAALAWRSSSLPCVRACVRFFLPSWAQL